MEHRFTALRIIGTVFKVLAWLVLILGLLGAIAALASGFLLGESAGLLGMNLGEPLFGVAGFVVLLLFSIINFLFLYAVGESIYLLLSMEESSRRTAYFTQQVYAAQQATYPPPPATDYQE